jgi:hypothetical protein
MFTVRAASGDVVAYSLPIGGILRSQADQIDSVTWLAFLHTLAVSMSAAKDGGKSPGIRSNKRVANLREGPAS